MFRCVALHEFRLGAVGTNDIVSVSNESATHQRILAHGADEAVIVPMPVFERNESCAANSSDRLATAGASLGEQLAEAVSAVGLLVAGGEPLPGQREAAVGAGEALAVPRLVLVGHPSARDYLVALDTASGELLLVAGGAVDLLFARNKALGADGRFAHATAEALLVPLTRLVLHLLRAGSEYLRASVAS